MGGKGGEGVYVSISEEERRKKDGKKVQRAKI